MALTWTTMSLLLIKPFGTLPDHSQYHEATEAIPILLKTVMRSYENYVIFP